jgi:hypothetical protein
MLYSPFKRLKSTHSRVTHVFLASISLFLLATIPLLTTPNSLFPAIAQTTDAGKTEADRLVEQGIQQLETRACFQTRCILENRRSQPFNAHEPRRLK